MAIRGAFIGESMFYNIPEGSKVCRFVDFGG
ncbi:MAG: hypothetical protein ACO33E_06350 [Aquiluna sp.]